MKTKTIKQVLRKKVDEWLATIEDEQLRAAAKQDTIITGGCIASMLLKEKVNDYDIYFRTRDTAKRIAEYYIARFHPVFKAGGVVPSISVETREDRVKIVIKSAGIASEAGSAKPYEYFESRAAGDPATSQYVGEVMQNPADIEETYEGTERQALEADDEPKYRPVFMSTNAITLSNRVQLVLRFFGEPDEIHANYDFVHCTNYWTSKDDKLALRRSALEALLSKELFYVGSKYPVCSLFRIRKFIQRGWTINAGQILKMAMQVSALDLTNIEVLQDQLTGVDCAYFCEVISKLKEQDPEKVNYAYLIEIVDRMFGHPTEENQ